MPENETLMGDRRSASRWRLVRERLDQGATPLELFPEIEKLFYRSLQKVWECWRTRDVDPARLFNAALDDPSALRVLIKQLSFDPNARLLRDVSIASQCAGIEQLICKYLSAAWGGVETQIGLHCHGESQSVEFTQKVQRMLNRIAQRLIENPSRIPNRPQRDERPPDLDTQLSESLLQG